MAAQQRAGSVCVAHVVFGINRLTPAGASACTGRSEPRKHQRSCWTWAFFYPLFLCLLIQKRGSFCTMAGLVHGAYQGCLQERRPISHSSCFDVRYRGPPVPLHALRHAQPFELPVSGKAAVAPQRVAPHTHLISFGACESARSRKTKELSWFVRKKGLTSHGKMKERFGGQGATWATECRIDRCWATLSAHKQNYLLPIKCDETRWDEMSRLSAMCSPHTRRGKHLWVNQWKTLPYLMPKERKLFN